MYLSPEAFLEKYEREGNPFYVIYDGTTANEKKRVATFLIAEGGTNKELALAEGKEGLEAFFAQFPAGKVYIMTKGHRNSDNQYAIYTKVQWGDLSVSGVQQQGSTMMPGMGNMQQLMQMLTFASSIFQPQVAAAKKEMELKYEIEKLNREKEEMQQLGPDDIKTAAMGELIGLIKPIGEAIAGGFKMNFKPPTQQAQSSISGTSGEPGYEPKRVQQNSPVSFDQLIASCKAIHSAVPEYHINDLFTVLSMMIHQNKETLVPLIDQAMNEYLTAQNQPEE